jgi:hypothetical protein
MKEIRDSISDLHINVKMNEAKLCFFGLEYHASWEVFATQSLFFQIATYRILSLQHSALLFADALSLWSSVIRI